MIRAMDSFSAPEHSEMNWLLCRVFCLAAELPQRHIGLFLVRVICSMLSVSAVQRN